MLREKGINRTGNLLVPNDNYCLFEDWVMPILDQMLVEQRTNVSIFLTSNDRSFSSQILFCMIMIFHLIQDTLWTPSKIIERLGIEINHPESIYYWAAKNKIPVFSPALTDGSLGDMMYFHSFRNPGLVLDILSGKCSSSCHKILISSPVVRSLPN